MLAATMVPTDTSWSMVMAVGFRPLVLSRAAPRIIQPTVYGGVDVGDRAGAKITSINYFKVDLRDGGRTAPVRF